jgi:hypothetical protein
MIAERGAGLERPNWRARPASDRRTVMLADLPVAYTAPINANPAVLELRTTAAISKKRSLCRGNKLRQVVGVAGLSRKDHGRG